MKSAQIRKDNIQTFYEMQEILGEGAFGKVLRAVNKETSEQVAIKMIQKSNLDPEEVKNIMTEIKVAANVEHPNIVKMIEVFESPTSYFIVFEIMSGGELFDRICEKEHYSEKEAANTMKPILDALRFCHSQGIVHRDIKPENMLYAEPSEGSIVKLADFGMARVLENKSELMSTMCGTPQYLAPEILNNQKYTASCDIWSLGIVLYVMLCGFAPFDSDSNEENVKNIKAGKVTFPSPDWDSVTENAKDLVRKMLTADPAKRITADEILKHPWMMDNVDQKLDIKDKLRKYNIRRKFKVAQYVAYLSTLFKKK